MHLPYPSRKSSNPTPFLPRGSSTASLTRGFSLPRRYRNQAVAIAALFVIALVWLLTSGGGSRKGHGGPAGMANHEPSGKPPAVLVTVLDEARFGARYTGLLKENRKLYAEKHGTSERRMHEVTELTRSLAQATRHSSPRSATMTSRARLRPGPRSSRCATP